MDIRVPAGLLSALFLSTVFCPVDAAAQTAPTYKVGWFNIQSGKGEAPLPGHPSSFVENLNCTDPSQPLNAWGVGVIQAELKAKIGADPSVIALGVTEAWTCGSPDNVRNALGWPARTAEHNGLSLLARYGFAAPEQWIQLDTSSNVTPNDTKWTVRAVVCVDAACKDSVIVYATHWLGNGVDGLLTYDKQLHQTLDFMAQDASKPHLLIGDLNTFEGAAPVCSQSPNNNLLGTLRAAGYVDLWPAIHGDAEGYTGMANRAKCGVPEGYAWKRIDYAWLKGLEPRGMTRFAMAPPGDGAPSDHYGIIAAFSAAPAQPVADPGEIVLGVSSVSAVAGLWQTEADSTAAEGRRMRHPNHDLPKITTPSATPANYFEATFVADAGRPYRLWIRGRADANSYNNDSVFVQFSNSVTSTGAPIYRIGTTSATTFILEDCTNCGVDGWGWQDNGYGLGVLGPLIRFATSGPQTIRVQTREDGLAIDQIVLSAGRYLTSSPGATKQDATLLR